MSNVYIGNINNMSVAAYFNRADLLWVTRGQLSGMAVSPGGPTAAFVTRVCMVSKALCNTRGDPLLARLRSRLFLFGHRGR